MSHVIDDVHTFAFIIMDSWDLISLEAIADYPLLVLSQPQHDALVERQREGADEKGLRKEVRDK